MACQYHSPAQSHDTAVALRVLKRELDFIDRGGYRQPVAWRSTFLFEDSPTCLRDAVRDCTASCPLSRFVPLKCRSLPSPCRYIPLNAAGQTADSLYRTAPPEEAEAVLRNWLVATIAKLETGSK